MEGLEREVEERRVRVFSIRLKCVESREWNTAEILLLLFSFYQLPFLSFFLSFFPQEREGHNSTSDNFTEKPTTERRAVFAQCFMQQHSHRFRWGPMSGKHAFDRVPPELHPEPSDGHTTDLVLDARDVDVESADCEM